MEVTIFFKVSGLMILAKDLWKLESFLSLGFV